MFKFLTHVELSRSKAAILDMPQYVAYQKNVAYAFIKLSAKSHSFNIFHTMDGLSCPTNIRNMLLMFCFTPSKSHTFNRIILHNNATFMCLAALLYNISNEIYQTFH